MFGSYGIVVAALAIIAAGHVSALPRGSGGDDPESHIWAGQCPPEQCPWRYPPFNGQKSKSEPLDELMDPVDGYPGSPVDDQMDAINVDAQIAPNDEEFERQYREWLKKLAEAPDAQTAAELVWRRIAGELPHSVAPRRPDLRVDMDSTRLPMNRNPPNRPYRPPPKSTPPQNRLRSSQRFARIF